MNNKVVITASAARDIEEQFYYIHTIQAEPLNAARWLEGIWEVIDALEFFAG